MKSCILILLLGFDDELDSIIERFSNPNAKRYNSTYRSVINDDGTEPVDPLTNRHYFPDKLTILNFEVGPSQLPTGSRLPRYRTCFVVSLVEPFPAGNINAHQEIFKAVSRYLESTPGWSNQFKIAVKHHSMNVNTEFVGFDWRLLQNLVVPGTYTSGFQEGKVFDPTDPTQTRMISLFEARKISSIISKRISGEPIPIDTLAKWIALCLPQSFALRSFDSPAPSPSQHHDQYQYCWNAANPLRVSLNGCYAGSLGSLEEDAVITHLARALATKLVGAHIRIIGMNTWTFYKNWRAGNAFPEYTESLNSDPFRGAVEEDQESFFVHTSIEQSTRRNLKYVAVVTPDLNGVPRITYLPLALDKAGMYFSFDRTIEKIKNNILGKLSDTFYEINGKTPLPRYLRIPVDVSVIIRDINSMVVSVFTLDTLRGAQSQILDYLSRRLNQTMQQADTLDRRFTIEYINQLYRTIKDADLLDEYVKSNRQTDSIPSEKKAETLEKKFDRPGTYIENGKDMVKTINESTIDKSQHSMQQVFDSMRSTHNINSWNDKDPLDG